MCTRGACAWSGYTDAGRVAHRVLRSRRPTGTATRDSRPFAPHCALTSAIEWRVPEMRGSGLAREDTLEHAALYPGSSWRSICMGRRLGQGEWREMHVVGI